MTLTFLSSFNSFFTWRTALILGIAVVLVLLSEHIQLIGLAFFFAGPCNDSCSSDDGGCSSGGSSDGGGDTGGNCGCNSANCSTGECTSGCSDGNVSSTPYLYVKKNDEYVMQNDVMMSYPVTAVRTREEGEEKRRSGMLGSDLYHLDLVDVDRNERSRVALKLKEIEAEESFIYRLRSHAYAVPNGHTVMPAWDHIRLISFPKEAQRQPQSRIVLNDNTDCTDRLANDTKKHPAEVERKNSLRLEKGDVLTFTARKEEGNRLVVSSFWRNWTIGDLADDIHGLRPRENAVRSPWQLMGNAARKVATRVMVLATVLAGTFFGNTHTPQSETAYGRKQDDLLAFIKKCNSVKVAHADSPHTYSGESLLVSYKHPNHGAWIHIATVQPRAYLPLEEYIVLRDEAYDENGQATIKIEATKGHYLKNLSFISGEVTELKPKQSSGLMAVHQRGEETLSEFSTPASEDLAEPIHLIAGDELMLTTDSVLKEANYLALELYGYYTPLSPEGAVTAGDWQKRLELRERALVESFYG